MSKARLTVYLSDSVADQLAIACKRPGANKSKLVDRALDRFLASDGGNGSDATLLRRFDLMTKQSAKSDRNIAVILETLGLFVRYYLTITPPLPKSEQEPARGLGNQRFEFFVTQIGKRLATGQSVVRDVMERVAANDPDLFTRDIDEFSLTPKQSSAQGRAPTPSTSRTASSLKETVSGASSELPASEGGARE